MGVVAHLLVRTHPTIVIPLRLLDRISGAVVAKELPATCARIGQFFPLIVNTGSDGDGCDKTTTTNPVYLALIRGATSPPNNVYQTYYISVSVPS